MKILSENAVYYYKSTEWCVYSKEPLQYKSIHDATLCYFHQPQGSLWFNRETNEYFMQASEDISNPNWVKI